MSYWENTLLLEAIKRELKKQKMTYRELADAMSISVPTLKRVLAGGSCSLERLTAICRQLNLSLFELASLAHEQGAVFHELTLEQESFFAEKPHYYWFLHRLLRGTSLMKIQEESNLNERSIFRYLRGLEKLGLLDLGPGRRFRFTFGGYVEWKQNGPLFTRFLLPQINSFTARLCRSSVSSSQFLNLADRPMAAETLAEFLADLQNLMAKYDRRSRQDCALYPAGQLKMVRWMLAGAPYEADWAELIPEL